MVNAATMQAARFVEGERGLVPRFWDGRGRRTAGERLKRRSFCIREERVRINQDTILRTMYVVEW